MNGQHIKSYEIDQKDNFLKVINVLCISIFILFSIIFIKVFDPFKIRSASIQNNQEAASNDSIILAAQSSCVREHLVQYSESRILITNGLLSDTETLCKKLDAIDSQSIAIETFTIERPESHSEHIRPGENQGKRND